MMKNKIKWKKLKKISEEITGIKVNITLTTTITDDRKAIVVFNKTKADIVINGNKVKDIKDVIDGIAHELTHVLLKSSKHSDKFLSMWANNYSMLKIKYYNTKTKIN